MRPFLLILPALLMAQEPPVPVFGTTVVIPSGLKGDVYHVREGMESLTELSKLTPKGSIYTTALNVPPQAFNIGFPGVTDRFEWFAIDYNGKFWIEKPGMYRFRLMSDDGSMLYIDDQLIADNDGTHAPSVRIASIRLAGGMHRIRVQYYQGPRDTVALVLDVAGPGERPRPFSTEEFRPPANPDDWRFPGDLLTASSDPHLDRFIPERIPSPRERKKKR